MYVENPRIIEFGAWTPTIPEKAVRAHALPAVYALLAPTDPVFTHLHDLAPRIFLLLSNPNALTLVLRLGTYTRYWM